MSQTRALRSGSCWTCKLRRKKCDEAKPHCEACVTRMIDCHGYGPRPEWMDGSVLQQRELEAIQKIVKENKRRNRKIYLREQADRRRQELAAEDGATATTSTAAAAVIEAVSTGNDQATLLTNDETFTTLLPEQNDMMASEERIETPLSPYATRSLVQNDFNFRFSHHREYELLMHYLDHVFAIQFRFHVPTVSSGGRGWLLYLLTETKPLYSAVLSLGALHQHTLLRHSLRGIHYHDTWNELNEHHNRALQELQVFLQDSYGTNTEGATRKRKLQILACGVAFISFELFKGGTSDWDLHLNALTEVLLGNAYENNDVNQTPQSLVSSPADTSRIQSLEDTAESFLTGAIIWFESLSCASTGRGPRLLDKYQILLEQGDIDLSNIAGFQSWIAIIIGEIAALGVWKREAEATHTLSFWQLFQRGDSIRRRLSGHIDVLRAELANIIPTADGPQIDFATAYLVMADPALHAQAVRRAVTLVFAQAALVYLHTTISGANPALAEIVLSVSATANALQELRAIADPQHLRSLVWPICIAGSMANEPTLQGFFRGLIEGLGEEALIFGNSGSVLRVMEKCWEYRCGGISEGERYCDWAEAMDLTGQRILLV